MKQVTKLWIETQLLKFPFVNWDRYIEFANFIVFYGWIERTKDNYKDFLTLHLDIKEIEVTFTLCSSLKYSKEITKILGFDKHLDCHRVEDNFKISNSVKLKQEHENL